MLFLVFLSPVDTKMFLIKAFVTNGDLVDRYLMGMETTSWKHLQIKKYIHRRVLKTTMKEFWSENLE